MFWAVSCLFGLKSFQYVLTWSENIVFAKILDEHHKYSKLDADFESDENL
jgi:hypothetical protein